MTGNRYICVYILLHILNQYLGCILGIHYLQYSCGSKIFQKKLPIDFLYIMNILLDVYTYGIYKICIIVNYVIDMILCFNCGYVPNVHIISYL